MFIDRTLREAGDRMRHPKRKTSHNIYNFEEYKDVGELEEKYRAKRKKYECMVKTLMTARKRQKLLKFQKDE